MLSKSSTLTRAVARLLNCSSFFHAGPTDIGSVGIGMESGKLCMTFGSETGLYCLPASAVMIDTLVCLSLSGSNQARKGRLVNALAARGDERRDTLR